MNGRNSDGRTVSLLNTDTSTSATTENHHHYHHQDQFAARHAAKNADTNDNVVLPTSNNWPLHAAMRNTQQKPHLRRNLAYSRTVSSGLSPAISPVPALVDGSDSSDDSQSYATPSPLTPANIGTASPGCSSSSSNSRHKQTYQSHHHHTSTTSSSSSSAVSLPRLPPISSLTTAADNNLAHRLEKQHITTPLADNYSRNSVHDGYLRGDSGSTSSDSTSSPKSPHLPNSDKAPAAVRRTSMDPHNQGFNQNDPSTQQAQTLPPHMQQQPQNPYMSINPSSSSFHSPGIDIHSSSNAGGSHAAGAAAAIALPNSAAFNQISPLDPMIVDHPQVHLPQLQMHAQTPLLPQTSPFDQPLSAQSLHQDPYGASPTAFVPSLPFAASLGQSPNQSFAQNQAYPSSFAQSLSSPLDPSLTIPQIPPTTQQQPLPTSPISPQDSSWFSQAEITPVTTQSFSPQDQPAQPRSRVSSSRSSRSSGISSTPRQNGKKNSYPCPLATEFSCKEHFTTSGHAARHAKKHTGKKDAKCPECGKGFTRKDNMEQHRRTHMSGKSSRNAAAAVA